jgi:hypothetical protein
VSGRLIGRSTQHDMSKTPTVQRDASAGRLRQEARLALWPGQLHELEEGRIHIYQLYWLGVVGASRLRGSGGVVDNEGHMSGFIKECPLLPGYHIISHTRWLRTSNKQDCSAASQ